MTSLRTISPQDAAALVRKGAVLIDVRDAEEHARENIPGARHRSLARLGTEPPVLPGDGVVIFHCRSGARTSANAAALAAGAGACEAFILEGGIDAWKKAGLPTARDPRQPIEPMRQVQIAAGSLVLFGVLMGAFVAPAFYALSAFVGAGLIFAGVSGFCGLARLLALMPWNRRSYAAAR